MKALYPGSFDPPTMGHLNVIERCAAIFSHLHIVVATNPHKHYAFSQSQRVQMIRTICAHLTNIHIHYCDQLIVEFAKEIEVGIIVRGVRAHEDFEYEFQLSLLNRGLNPAIETLFIPTDPRYFVLRSSTIRELARLGGDISTMVPPAIVEDIKKRFSTTV